MIGIILAPLKKYLLMGAAAAALLYGAYLYGHHVSEEEHAQKIKDLNLGIAITAAGQAKLVEQQSRIDVLKKELADARTKISRPDDTCFEPDDVDGLLDIWPKPAASPAR
ncbi:hypothetical protein [Rhizobium laguerreae]|uniref:hypothetical protein n=1 Tax=Rhizobium laguerreae TaxID=1076926 RepID=UPI001C920A80|nr:hypothetical protein [Rhizobium laguerreae]MBY3223127.1 hypothetical protein [Rhizobium laguerreae]